MNPMQQAMFPFIMPWQPPQRPDRPDHVPARVRCAMAFLEQMTAKTAEKGMANDIGFDSIEGQPLVIEEQQAHAAACAVMVKYFEDKLPMDAWEEAEAKDARPETAGSLIRCPNCAGQRGVRGKKCVLCEGSGSLLVYPTVGDDAAPGG